MSNGGVTFAAAIDRKMFLDDRRKFFCEVYGQPLPRVPLPVSRVGFGWGGIMAPFMTPQYLFAIAGSRTGAWKYSDESLDVLVAHNDRDAAKTGAYALWCRDRMEADEEHAGKSRDRIIADGIKGMTLVEYMDLFIWFHWKTGKLLDCSSRTLCTGSRYPDGSVPHVHSYYGEMRVYWCLAHSDNLLLRSREVVVVG